MIKICCISDTHAEKTLKYLDIPECDILIHAGDISFMGHEYELRAFDAWVKELKKTRVKHVVMTLGNHEVAISQNMSKLREWMPSPDHILIHESCEVMGLKIFGSPYTPEFMDWAFLYNQQQAQTIWEAIPDNTDIVITHGPPYGYGDKLSEIGSEPGKDIGCPYLLKALDRVKPVLHVYGHNHHGAGIYTHNNTKIVNAAVLDDRYYLVNKPVVLDIEPKAKL